MNERAFSFRKTLSIVHFVLIAGKQFFRREKLVRRNFALNAGNKIKFLKGVAIRAVGKRDVEHFCV